MTRSSNRAVQDKKNNNKILSKTVMLTNLGDEQVLRLHVPVQDSANVTVCQATQQLEAKLGRTFLHVCFIH